MRYGVQKSFLKLELELKVYMGHLGHKINGLHNTQSPLDTQRPWSHNQAASLCRKEICLHILDLCEHPS